ncbi:hypothetical protein JAAARDRAFT_189682 [Jaapia argillacea MUCL 33604]|uniref:Uncharacterized protein n=1 Tax=Jaapia argillacea MUCL 33604 TaxID=933084 RepID=A0A067QIC1_9AGAM|nr:hypothetical protein JAAARDRAFT_189682 [Jaapia argillacea MUCL 33604]
MSGTGPITNRMALNNLLLERGETHLLTWQDTAGGSAFHRIWTSVVFFKGEECGRAFRCLKGDAREAADGQALQSLR